MATNLPSLDESHGELLRDFRARFGSSVSTRRRGTNWKLLRTFALGVWSVFHRLGQVARDALPTTAVGDALTAWGDGVYQLPRKGATTSRKAAALRVQGTVAATAAIGETLVHQATGLRFELRSAVVIPAAGYVDADVASIDTGSATLLEAGEVLTFESPPAGINAAAELQINIDEGGDDAELDQPYRPRVLNRIRQPPMGGNVNDYVQWATAVDDIASAFVYRGRNGKGSVDLVALHTGSGAVRVPNAAKLLEVEEYVDERRPVHPDDFRVLTITTQAQAITVLLTIFDDAAYRFDWDDSTPPVVSAWASATRQVTFTAARPAGMAVGHRVTFDAADVGSTGQEFKIEQLVDTDKIILEAPGPSFTLASPDTCYSGGPLVKPIRDALLAMINALGPARAQAAESFAAHVWEDSIKRAHVYRIAVSQEGVDNLSIPTPAADVSPVDPDWPNPGTVLLVPGQILVRKA